MFVKGEMLVTDELESIKEALLKKDGLVDQRQKGLFND